MDRGKKVIRVASSLTGGMVKVKNLTFICSCRSDKGNTVALFNERKIHTE
jgi:hypothetical protein